MIQVRRFLPFVVLAAGLSLALAGAANPAFAQDPAQRIIQQRTGQEVTQAQILQRLQASGLTRAQVQERLREMGYDPGLANPYFDRLEGGEAALGTAPAPDFLQALGALGLLTPGMEEGMEAEEAGEETVEEEPLEEDRDRGADAPGVPIFGRDVFSGPSSRFQPVTSGPVDPDYRLGPGDQLILVITGDVELAYTLEVTREGFIVIPDVGQVSVNGLTLEGLRERLYDRLGRAYSGVRRDADATTFFDVSLGRLRTNLVFVIGEVSTPGAYQVSSVATLFNALHVAGGPSVRGSFRNIEVRRGGRVVAEVDLYDYLLRGDASQDIRLQQGDIVFIPLSGPRVAVRGSVRRNAVFEFTGEEDLADVLGFAGGLLPQAYRERIQVNRILPPEQRYPGVERVVVDVDGDRVLDGEFPFALRDGDVVEVFRISSEVYNRVTVRGDVTYPGTYEFRQGSTLWSLIERAGGLVPDAYEPRVHILRQVPDEGTVDLIQVSLALDEEGAPVEDHALQDQDEVVVYALSTLLLPRTVAISGLVKNPGRYPFADGMTAEDLVLAAGGFEEGAQAFEAEITRRLGGIERMDSVSESFFVILPPEIPSSDGWLWEEGVARRPGALPADSLPLRDGDRVFVRRLPGFVTPGQVQIGGEVTYPGEYSFQYRQERLSSFLDRAGGLTPDAYAGGARLVRDSLPVGINFQAALRDPGGSDDIVLEPGDQLVVPTYDPTVRVLGAVAFPSRVVYRKGMDVGDFLAHAGGAVDGADLGRISVEYPNGERATTWKFLLFRNQPDVRPGSTIYVPPVPEGSGTNWDQFFTRTLSITSTVLTLLIAIDRLGG